MSNVQRYAEFISEQIYHDINELFSSKDKGYSYKKDVKPSDLSGEHFYHIDLPDNTQPAEVHISHIPVYDYDHPKTPAQTGMVGFTMPAHGYGISPEAKKTYHKTFNDKVDKGHDHFDAHHSAVTQVDLRHGPDQAEKAIKSWGSDAVVRSHNSASAHHNYGIMASVSKILHDHGKSNPDIHHFMFSSSGDHPSRERLYKAIAKKHGGETHTDVNDESFYTIPNPYHKEEAK